MTPQPAQEQQHFIYMQGTLVKYNMSKQAEIPKY